MKKTNALVLSTLTAALLIGCGGGSSSGGTTSSTDSGTTTPTITTTDVIVERGPVYRATVSDANGQIATQKDNSNVYTFATAPVYPITAIGGIIDVDGNGIDEGDIELTTPLTSYSNVVTPITTYLGDTTKTEGKSKLDKLKSIAGLTDDNDLLKKVPSELSSDVLVLTNALYDIINDGDSSNDDFISDYDNSEFKTKIADYKTEADKYTDKKELSKALEEKVITARGFTKITTDEVTNVSNGTYNAKTLKVADLTRFVSYESEDDTFDDNTVANGKIEHATYSLTNTGWALEVVENPDYNTITIDSTNPYKLTYVDSLTKEEGIMTILSTKKLEKYTDLYKSTAEIKVTKQASEFDWVRSSQNPTYWENSQQIAITNVDSLEKMYLLNNSVINFNKKQFVLNANGKVYLEGDTSKPKGKWSKDSDKLIISVDIGIIYIRVISENSAYYIEQTNFVKEGQSTLESMYTGSNLDQFIADIKTPAPEFTSWGNTYALENQTSAYTPTVKDTLPLTYSISGGIDADKFNIDTKTAIVTFKTAPDYETKIAYSFIIKVTNSANKSSIQEVNIKITDVIEPFQSGQTFKGLVYNIVTSPITGIQWLDRNIGASQACTSSTDSACYGDYYQWGRLADGHEKITSIVSSIQVDSIRYAGNKFITGMDWTTVDSNGNLRATQWSKTDGTSVCPVGFRVPTKDELKKETLDFTGTTDITTGAVKVVDSMTAFQNFLQLPVSGYRSLSEDGLLSLNNEWGYVWTNNVSNDTNSSWFLNFSSTNHAFMGNDYSKSVGFPVRCIKGN